MSTTYIVSDLHLGAGQSAATEASGLEDFFAHDLFAQFLSFITDDGRTDTELVLLGDTFDFPQVLPELGKLGPQPADGTTQEESLRRTEAIVAGHSTFFAAMADFVRAGNTLRIIRGNHDVDLVWPCVQSRLRAALGADRSPGLIFEPGPVYRRGALHLEHGNQWSNENAFEHPEHPVLMGSDGKPRLERCWGTYFMDVMYNDIEARFPHIDNVDQMFLGTWRAIRSARRRFTARQVGRFIRIAWRAGLPVFGWAKAGLMGDDDPGFAPTVQVGSTADVLAHLQDEAIAEDLSACYREDLQFRATMDQELAPMVETLRAEPRTLQPRQDEDETMGLLTRMDAYERRARTMLEVDASLQLVVFGHTHDPLQVSVDGHGTYINSGSWTRNLDLRADANRDLSFDELHEHATYKTSLDYVRVVEEQGRVHGEVLQAGVAPG